MTNFIAIGSPEHAKRLAWRNPNGYRDASRYSREASLLDVHDARVEAQTRHSEAVAAGGYVNPYESVADVLATDPLVVGYDHIARDLLSAEQLLEVHQRTGINLSIFGGVSDLVDWALDYSGSRFDADVEPQAAEF